MPAGLRLSGTGRARFAGAALALLPALEAALREVPQLAAGTRLRGDAELTDLLARAGPQFLAADAIGKGARPVRAVLFNKAPESNWALGWHQDRTICVRARRDVAGFANWTVKQGMLHVEPPFGLLERMATMRVHLDDAGPRQCPVVNRAGIASAWAPARRCGRACGCAVRRSTLPRGGGGYLALFHAHSPRLGRVCEAGTAARAAGGLRRRAPARWPGMGRHLAQAERRRAAYPGSEPFAPPCRAVQSGDPADWRCTSGTRTSAPGTGATPR